MKKLSGLLNIDKKNIRWAVIVIIILLVLYGYYVVFIRNPYTTDATIQGHWIKIAARVSGPVTSVMIKNNQVVKQGQVLFQIDPTIYQLQVNLAIGNLRAIDQKLAALQQDIKVATHVIEEKQSLLTLAQSEFKRFSKLAREGAASVEKFNEAQAKLGSLQAQLSQARFGLEKLKAELGSLEDNGMRQAAVAQLNIAKRNLNYTKVRATSHGIISNFYLRKGDYINKGVNLFSLVEQQGFWVQANFLEFELRRIKPGQNAEIRLAMYPHHTFKGKVSAIGPGISRGLDISSSTELPIVEETINWLRLFSRFPVFIHFTESNPRYPLRVGATAAVIVHAK